MGRDGGVVGTPSSAAGWTASLDTRDNHGHQTPLAAPSRAGSDTRLHVELRPQPVRGQSDRVSASVTHPRWTACRCGPCPRSGTGSSTVPAWRGAARTQGSSRCRCNGKEGNRATGLERAGVTPRLAGAACTRPRPHCPGRRRKRCVSLQRRLTLLQSRSRGARGRNNEEHI